jgi:hypothetical protein
MVAGQFGLDLGSLTGGNGVLAGDNVLELAKSKLLLQRALQTPYPLAGKDSTYSLADHYIATMGWNKKWESSSKVGFAVSFATTKNKFTRVEDSLFGIVLKRIVENSGKNGIFILEELQEKEFSFGYDAANDKFGNMYDFGIIDPAKVTRSAIQNAASIASMILTTECIVVNKFPSIDNV